MKLSDLRPCDCCRGPIGQTFYVVRYGIAVINPNAGNTVLGMAQMFRGSLALAEAMAPQADCVSVSMDEPEYRGLMTELFICSDCFSKHLCLPMIAEKQFGDTEET